MAISKSDDTTKAATKVRAASLAGTLDAKPKMAAVRWHSVGNQAQAHTPVPSAQSQTISPSASPEAAQRPRELNKSDVKEEQQVARPKRAEENPTHPYVKGREQVSAARAVGKVATHMAFGITGGYVVNKLIDEMAKKKNRNVIFGKAKLRPRK